MFEEWLKLAGSMLAIAVLIAIMVGGIESFIPLFVVGGVVYLLFHAAKGFAQADQTRHDGRRKGK